jgi:carbon monoxide dehydrogenase subunit G
MLATALVIVAAIVVVFVIIVALRPTDFRIQRTALIAAPAQAVFAQVNDFRKWQAWSPWEKLDPALKRTYEGATYAWVGNKKVGEGRMTITESRPGELVRIKLEFFKPFAATNTTEFTFKPEGGGTAVTWSMTGRHNFMAKAFCLFVSMEKMVGGQFEQGLAQMKSIVETPAKT